MEPFLSLTIARQNSDMGAAKRRFAVASEMSSATRPKKARAQPRRSQSSSTRGNNEIGLDLEMVLQRGPIYMFIVRFFPIFCGIMCAIGAIATVYADLNTRWSYSTQAKFASYARAHSEPFRASQMPTIFKIVDTFTEYRTLQEMRAPQGDGVIVNNVTPGFSARTPEAEAKDDVFDILAIGSARVAAEAIRSEDARKWNLYVPRTISELVDYTGDAFVSGIVLAGDEHAFFPAAKSYSFLHDGGLVVQHLPPHMNGRAIYQSYERVFGKSNVRTQAIHAGSRLIIAVKHEFKPAASAGSDPLPYEQGQPEEDSLEKQYMDYHYLTM